jgi:hypothetical protein
MFFKFENKSKQTDSNPAGRYWRLLELFNAKEVDKFALRSGDDQIMLEIIR